MIELKPGTRLRSAVCDVEVIVIKTPSEPVDLRCGGHPMQAVDADPPGGLSADPAFADGSALGKRYTDEDGTFEVLCTKAGPSSLSIGEVSLRLKEAKPLPSSD